MLLGSWDNYYATPSNYYLYNSGRQGAANDFASSPYFHFIPWDYDTCLGIDYFGTHWQYADILDWRRNTRRYWRNRHTPSIPLVQNLLRNSRLPSLLPGLHRVPARYRLHPESLSAQIGAQSEGGLRTAFGRPPTWNRTHRTDGRSPVGSSATTRSTGAACRQHELRHGRKTMEGIVHYVRMRRDSARAQLNQLKADDARAADGFPAATEQLRRAA